MISNRLTLQELQKKRPEKRLKRAEMFHRLMKENDWSRAELARQLGVSRAWVRKVLCEIE